LVKITFKFIGIIMKKLVLILRLGIYSSVFAQYKDPGFPTENVKDGIIDNSYSSGNLFGFLNSENFQMNHQFSMSYSSFGGNGIALGVYTNSMLYSFAENLNVQADVSFVNSPYSTLGQDFQNSLNGIYLSRAAVNYQPWKDVSISLQYRQLPYHSPYSYYGNSMFDRLGYYDPFIGY
jgi:hypothetical protein